MEQLSVNSRQQPRFPLILFQEDMNIHCYNVDIFTELQKIMVLMSLRLVCLCVFVQGDFEHFLTNRMMQKW